jgi:hypothetical protein
MTAPAGPSGHCAPCSANAAIAAILGGEEQIGRKLLDMTATDYAAEEFERRTAEGEPVAPTPLRKAE